ncbi:hypothetical protein ACTMTI_17990 [Nonomuraea sp. H19]|uniref:hypothetical protein n=1 Tax=Nonomuraea sp. H19 TaxID=3452206 RepID=UPI003F88B65A
MMEPLWARAGSLFARETERIGAAVVSRGLDAVLSGLSSPLRYVDGTLHLPHPPCRRYPPELNGRRLVLVPLASGFSASMCDVERAEILDLFAGSPEAGVFSGS